MVQGQHGWLPNAKYFQSNLDIVAHLQLHIIFVKYKLVEYMKIRYDHLECLLGTWFSFIDWNHSNTLMNRKLVSFIKLNSTQLYKTWSYEYSNIFQASFLSLCVLRNVLHDTIFEKQALNPTFLRSIPELTITMDYANYKMVKGNNNSIKALVLWQRIESSSSWSIVWWIIKTPLLHFMKYIITINQVWQMN